MTSSALIAHSMGIEMSSDDTSCMCWDTSPDRLCELVGSMRGGSSWTSEDNASKLDAKRLQRATQNLALRAESGLNLALYQDAPHILQLQIGLDFNRLHVSRRPHSSRDPASCI